MPRNSSIETKKYRFFIAEGQGTYVVPKKAAKGFLKDRSDLILHELKIVKST